MGPCPSLVDAACPIFLRPTDDAARDRDGVEVSPPVAGVILAHTTRTNNNVCAPRVLLCLPRRRLQGDEDPSTSLCNARRVRVRVRVACAGVVVVARTRAVWITARIRAYLCEARANSFARGARRATRCSPRRGVGYMCMNIMVALDARAVARCGRARCGFDRSRMRAQCAGTDECVRCIFARARRRPSLSPRRSRLTSTRNSVPTRVVVSPRSSRSVTKRTPSVK